MITCRLLQLENLQEDLKSAAPRRGWSNMAQCVAYPEHTHTHAFC